MAGSLLLALLLAVLLIRPWAPSAESTLAKTGIAGTLAAHAPLYQGEAWKPAAGTDGYAKAAENTGYELYVRPDNTQIAVVDKRNGYRWTSNPSAEELSRETVKGQLLANLKATFVLTYVRSKGADQTIRESVTSVSDGAEITMIQGEYGVEIRYAFPDKGLGFAIQYELTEKGLAARIPADGIREEGDYLFFAVDLLPYFGAAAKGEDGYLFVPDGPGGLIRFETSRAAISRGYLHEVYGKEISNMANWGRNYARREEIAFPVFGVKRGDQGFVAVLTQGGEAAQIAAMPPGIKSSLYNAYSSQLFREEYLYQMSRLATPAKAVQQERLKVDREVEYRFLTGAEASYIGMADSYRIYLQDNGQLERQLAPVEHIPLYLKLMGGNYQRAYGRIQYVATTTFAQATEMVNSLQNQGVNHTKVIFYGWQNQGDYNMEKRFPIESALGGEEAAKAFLREMKNNGTSVSFYEDFLWVDQKSKSSGKDQAIRAIDGTAFMDGDWFLAKPLTTARFAAETIGKLKELGVEGMLYSGLGEVTFNDYGSAGIRSREFTQSVYNSLLAYTRQELGSAGVFRGNAYTLGGTDYIDTLPAESSYDFMIDETVPFYPMVLHGYIPYSFGDGNLRDDESTEFLRAIEYGALPSFFLTYDDSRKLKDTNANYLYSSRFAKWEQRVVEEYGRFDQLAPVFSQRMINHEKLGEARYATTYENGIRVIVDYQAGSFTVEGGDPR